MSDSLRGARKSELMSCRGEWLVCSAGVMVMVVVVAGVLKV